MHLDGGRGELDALPGGAELGERHAETGERSVLPVDRRPRGEHERRRGLEVDQHAKERLAGQREVLQPMAEGLAAGGVDRRLEERPAHEAESHARDPEARRIHHLHHPVDAAPIERAAVPVAAGQQVGLGVDEIDLARRHRSCPELVLRALHVDAVRAAVSARARHHEERDPLETRRGPLGTRERGDRSRVDVGAEPLGAGEPPDALRLARRRGDRPEIGAAALLGHEHGPVPGVLEALGGEPREEALADLGGGEALDQADDAARHPDRTHEAGVGLAEKVVERAGHHGGEWPSPALRLASQPGAADAGLPGVPLGGERCRVVDDAADLLPPTIVALEARRTLVDRLGALRDRPTAECADPDQVAFRPFAVGRVEESIHEGPEVRIDGVPVEPDRPLEHAVVHHA